MKYAWHTCLLCVGIAAACTAQAAPLAALSKLSLEELGNIQVTSVSKRSESLNQAASAIYVISHADIARSGATSLAEILRLAPNLSVAQTSASSYVITARGFNGNSQAQNFSNKLLVLIDGRSVYSPLYSGVYWDMQQVMPADIERIEVISGPGATLWGANAVNGVINIITRSADATQGGLLEVSAGNQQRRGGIRYGGRINDELSSRVYASGFSDDDTLNSAGSQASDHWSNYQGGFRLDWTPGARDAVSAQGQAYRGSEAQLNAANEDISGSNLLASWTHQNLGGSEFKAQGYYDATERNSHAGGRFYLDTYDLDLQQSLTAGRQELLLGGGYRANKYRIQGTATLFFNPAEYSLNLFNIFIQDGIELNDQFKVILGLKFEDNPYAKPAAMPNARLVFTPSNASMVWLAISRAIRAATPFDRDVVEKVGNTAFLTGDAEFRSEKLLAYELGTRLQPQARTSLSISTFYNVYDDLRTIEVAPGGFLPLQWGNRMRGYTYGLEAWSEIKLRSWWRLTAAYSTLSKHLQFSDDASQLLGLKQAGDDPNHQASLKSSMDLGSVTLDAALRYVSALPDPQVPAYVDLNMNVGWRISQQLSAALSGFNLLHNSHQEYGGTSANYAVRSYVAKLQYRF